MSEPHRFFICLSLPLVQGASPAFTGFRVDYRDPPQEKGVWVFMRGATLDHWWHHCPPSHVLPLIHLGANLMFQIFIYYSCCMFCEFKLFPLLRVGNQIYLQWRLCRKQRETSWVGIKRAVDGIGAWSLRGKICSRNNNTLLNELCPQFHMRLVNTKARWWKTMSCSLWQRQSAWVWRTRVKGTGDGGEGDQGGNLNFTSRRRQHVIKKP